LKKEANKEPKDGRLAEIRQKVKEEEEKKINDMDDNYEFDADIDELGQNDRSVECIYRKIDYDKIKKDRVR